MDEIKTCRDLLTSMGFAEDYSGESKHVCWKVKSSLRGNCRKTNIPLLEEPRGEPTNRFPNHAAQ